MPTKKGIHADWQQPDKLILLQGWARDGLTNQQIAQNIGVREQTIYDWINRYPEIAQALKKGREVMVYEVENALYKAAIGYDVTETEQTETLYPDGTKIVNKRAKKRHIPPSVGAICFILKNRRGDYWRDHPVTIDTTALNKLDAILQEAKENANNEIQSEAE